MKCKLFENTPAAPTMPPNKDILPAGTIIDDPNAYMLVQIGMAEAADEECAAKANRTPAQLNQARYEYSRTKAGIHPDDYARYDNGEIVGYNLDGTVKPGPNYIDPDEEIEYDEEEEYEENE